MFSVPLPFVIALLLLVLLARLIRLGNRKVLPTILFVGACTALVSLVGLRWSFDLPAIRPVQTAVACLLPPLAWVLFAGLSRPMHGPRLLIHVLPVSVIFGLIALSPIVAAPLDLVLAMSYFGYGVALLRIAAAGDDGLLATRFSDTAPARRAALVAGAVLMASGTLDLLIAAAFVVFDVSAVRAIVGAANLVTLPLLAYAVAVVGQSLPDTPDAALPPPPDRIEIDADTVQDAATLQQIDALMRDKQLFKDPDLTLNRLARRALIPTRQISGAVNRLLLKNVSQMVNDYRIGAAKTLLATTDLPITTVMFDAGFQTKSNFNREFMRVVGQSPSDFRRSNAVVPSPRDAQKMMPPEMR